jgi:Zn ribbon nucleic-acid-binding protein
VRYLTVRRRNTDEAPTLEAWVIATLEELEIQRDRLLTGQACPDCSGAGKLATRGRLGVTWTACGECDGSGLKKNY